MTLYEDWLNGLEDEVDIGTGCGSIEEEESNCVVSSEENCIHAQPCTLMTNNLLPDFGKGNNPPPEHGICVASVEGKLPLSAF